MSFLVAAGDYPDVFPELGSPDYPDVFPGGCW